jgi:uncharacterized RDD family membrane protein YckC
MESKQQRVESVDPPTASLQLRGKAFFVDFFCGLLVPSVAAQAFAGQAMPGDAPIGPEVVGGLFVLLFVATYWVVVPYVCGGQTMGKRVFGLRIVSCVSEKPSLWQLALRTLCYVRTAVGAVQTLSSGSGLTGPLPHDVRARTRVVGP